ncbi:MAG: GNAT family N-acetyltransferase [Bacteroidota bacterium]
MILENYQTARLKLRSVTLSDKPLIMELFSGKVATAATQNLSGSGPSEPFVATWIDQQAKRYEELGAGLCIIELRDSRQVVGTCGLVRQFVDGIPKWEVNYHLLPRFWGQGFATEAAKACRNACFKAEMAETLISIIHPENKKSQAVAHRIGMTFWKNTVFKGAPAQVFRIRREEWEALLQVNRV